MGSHEPRITGGHSLHEEHDPTKCLNSGCRAFWRVVDCCKQTPEKDVEECATCGKQRQVACSFDDEYA